MVRAAGSALIFVLVIAMAIPLSPATGRGAEAAAPPLQPATPEQVQKAIERGIEYLYATQKDGNWEPTQSPNSIPTSTSGAQWTGITALVTYTLLSTGANTRDPRLQEAISFLKKNPTQGVYALGVRCQLWGMLSTSDDVKAIARKEFQLLLQSVRTTGEGAGLHGYLVEPSDYYDHSASQYAALGVWGATNSVLDLGLAPKYWDTSERSWRAHQNADGSWSYRYTPNTGQSMTMTAAAVGTLYMAQDVLRGSKGGQCNGNVQDDQIERGIKWMSDNFKTATEGHGNDGYHLAFYALYGMERIGMASGRRYFGKFDWFQYGASAIVHSQNERGEWNNVIDTCFAILFLVHGRQPVAMNKLQYEIDFGPPPATQPVEEEAVDPQAAKDPKKPGARPVAKKPAGDKANSGKPADPQPTTEPIPWPPPTNWNQRPRDVANLTHWIGKQTERELNWQVVHLNVPIDELHDSQILYMAGNQTLKFPDEEIAKLRQFVEEGGLILGNADCGSKEFAASFQQLGKQLFPGYDWRELPANHTIYTEEQFPRSRWRNPPSVLGLSNGVRELMLLIPQADPARTWQTNTYGGKEEASQLGSNIFLYSAERQNLRFKGVTHIVRRNFGITQATPMKLARLKYDGNWDPEPGGWTRLSSVLFNNDQIDLQVEPVTMGEGKLDAAVYKVAHLTGTGPIKLNEKAKAELRTFLENRGTLVIDAAGGNAEFATAIEKELESIVPGAKAPFTAIPPAHPAYAKVTQPLVRKYAMSRFGKSTAPLPAGIERGRRMGVFYSKLDLSAGLVGQPIDGITGYEPETATQIVSGIIRYAARK